MNRAFQIIGTLFFAICIVACSSSDNATEPVPDPKPVATPSVGSISISDIANFGDGRDLEIKFNKVSDETLISEYRVIILKSEKAGGFNLSSAESLTTENYTKVNKNGNNLQITLSETSKDSDGDLIVENQAYSCFVLTVGTGDNQGENALSKASNAVVLSKPEVSPVSNIQVLDVSNNGNAKDMELSFNKVIDETLISEYRVIVVKDSEADAFDIAKAESLDTDSYLIAPKNGTSKVLELNPGLNDSDGDPIIENIAYKVFVLSVANGTTVTESKMSSSVQAITLERKNAIRTLARFNNAGTGGMQVDSNGNIYMGNFGLNDNGGGTNVYKITPNGETSVFSTGFNTADGNDIDSNGNFYQVSYSTNTIYKITPDGSSKTVFASGGLLNGPIGIAVDGNDDLFVTNYNNNTVIKITQAGSMSPLAPSSLYNGPNGLDFDSSGNLYVSNWNTPQIVKIDKDTGTPTLFVTTPSSRNAHMIVKNDLIYVAGRSHHKIFKVTLAGEVSDFVGTGSKGDSNGSLATAKICWPNDIAFNADGSKMYLSMVDPSAATSNILSPAIVREVSIVE